MDMNGILSPEMQGILSGAFAGLNASGPSRMPVSLGQVIGAAGNAGMGTYQQAAQMAQQKRVQDQMIALEQQKAALTNLQVQQMLRQQALITPMLEDISKNPQKYGLNYGAPGSSTQGVAGQPGQGMPQSQGSQSSGIPGMGLATIGALANMPGLTELGKMQLNASTGIAQRPGAPVVNPITGQIIAQPTPSVDKGVQLNIGPNGPVASVVPGYPQAQGTIGSTPITKVQNADQTFSYVPNSQLVAASQPKSTLSAGGVPITDPQEQKIANAVMAADAAGIPASVPVPAGTGVNQPTGGGMGAAPRFGQTQAEQIQQAGQTESIKKVNEGQAALFNDQYATAVKGVQTLPMISAAKQALDSGAVTGFGANFFLNMNRALSAAGFKQSADATQNTQIFAATTARQVLSIIKNLGSGSGISDADREYAAKIVGGDIALDAPAIKRLLQISDTAIRNQANWVNGQVPKYQKLGADVTPIDIEQFAGTMDKGAAAPSVFDTLPNPSKYKGKIATDTATGKKYISDGMTWKKQ